MIRDIISNDLFTVCIVIGLILAAITKALFVKRFNDFVFVLGNSKYLKIYARDQKFFDLFDALLFANFVLSITVFGLLVYDHTMYSINISYFLLLKLALTIAIFIIIKILIERLIGSVFEIDSLIDNYLFQKISYKNFMGLLLIPINMLAIFSLSISDVLIYIILGIISLVFIIGIITTTKAHQNLIKQNLFYFILYLCALEIAPYIVLYHFVINV